MTQNRLKNPFMVTQFSINSPVEFNLDKTQDWVNELLTELNENADEENTKDNFRDTHLNLSLKVKKLNHDRYQDVIILELEVDSNYKTKCVKTLKDINWPLSLNSKMCFINNVFEKEEDLADQTELFISNDLHELYFFEKRMVDIKSAIHEQIHLYVDQYPSEEKLNQPQEDTELH